AARRLLGRTQTLIPNATPARAANAGLLSAAIAQTIAASVHTVAKTSLIGCAVMKRNIGHTARIAAAAALSHAFKPNCRDSTNMSAIEIRPAINGIRNGACDQPPITPAIAKCAGNPGGYVGTIWPGWLREGANPRGVKT